MKCFLALALLVGAVVSSSLNFYAWRPDQELSYKFESQTLTGIPEIKDSQFSGVKIQADIIVQTFRDFTLRIKLENARYLTVNDQHLATVDGRVRLPEATQELPSEFSQHLQRPFEAHLKRGVFEGFLVDASEPQQVTNIKKSILSQLQLDISGLRRDEIESNLIPSSNGNNNVNSGNSGINGVPSLSGDETSFFTTAEATVSGDCRTEYTVTKMSREQVQDMELSAELKKEQLKQMGLELDTAAGQHNSRAKEICANKPHFEIIKQKDLNECVHRPVFQVNTGVKSRCDYSKGSCADLISHTATTRYVICGTREEFHIRETQADNIISANPLAWATENEKMASVTSVSLYLVNARTGGFSPMPRPSQDSKIVNSLVFEYGTGQPKNRGPFGGSDRNSSYIHGIRAQPDLVSRSNIFPVYVSFSELKEQVQQQIREIVEVIYTSEGCSNKKDVAGKVTVVARALRPLSLEELKGVEQSVEEAFSSAEEKKQQVAITLFYDILSMSGSNPSVVKVLRKVAHSSQGQIDEVTARRFATSAIRNVFSPTEELLGEIFSQVKLFKLINGDLYARGLTQLSNLVYSACLNKGYRNTVFPVRIYGEFCNEKSRVIVGQMLPYIEQEIKSISNGIGNGDSSSSSFSFSGTKEYIKLSLINALGKIGHVRALPTLAAVAEGKYDESRDTIYRVLAVHAMKRMAREQPNTVRPVLMKLIDNAGENTEVRLAAVAMFPFAQPSVADMQKVAVRSWFEPSKQVASFIFTTYRTLTTTMVPELQTSGENAKTLLRLVKPFQTGITFAHTGHTDHFVRYLMATASGKASYTNSEYKVYPGRASVSSRFFGNAWEVNGITLTAYLDGMDAVAEQIADKVAPKPKASQQVQQQLEKIQQQLGINQQQQQQKSSSQDLNKAKAFLQISAVGYDIVGFVNGKSFNKLMQEITDLITSRPGDNFSFNRDVDFSNAVSYINAEGFGPTESGFPMYVQRTVPLVYGAKGKISVQGRLGQTSSVQTDVRPVLNAKLISNMGVILPFAKQFVGAGVEAALHVCLPVKTQAVLNKTGQLELSVRAQKPDQGEREFLHFFVKPYTVKASLQHVLPISQSGNAKKILTGDKIINREINLGKQMGIQSDLKIQADYRSLDFYSLWSSLEQHNFFSAATLGIMAPTCKESSFKFSFDASRSQTKEIDISFNLLTGSKSGQSGSVKVHMPTKSAVNKDIQTIKAECEQEQQMRQQVQQGSSSGVLSSLEKQQCVTKKVGQIKAAKLGAQKAEELLQQTSGSNTLYGISLEAGVNSRSERKSYNMVVVGVTEQPENQQGKHHQVKTTVKAHVSGSHMAAGDAFEIDTTSHLQLPLVSNRWNLDAILDEAVKMSYTFTTTYGKKGAGVKQVIALEGDFEKSQELVEGIRQSQEYERCQDEIQRQRELSSVCEETRHLASSIDRASIRLRLPQQLRRSTLLAKLESGLKSLLISHMFDLERQHQRLEGDDLELSVRVNRTGDAAYAVVRTQEAKYELDQLRVPQVLKGLVPLSLRNGISLRLVQDLTRDMSPASCRVEKRFISTFDNVTYGYDFNDCPHLIFKDCDSRQPEKVSVVLKPANGSGQQKKTLVVLLGGHHIELSQNQVIVNGQSVSVNTLPGKPYVSGSQEDEVIITRYQDGVLRVINPALRFSAFFNAQTEKIEIVAPKFLLKDTSCGMCGDNNGETTADVTTPNKCVMSSAKLASYSYMFKHSQCSGIPSEDKAQYEREIRQCFRKTDQATPIEQLAEKMVNTRPFSFSANHIVEEHATELCFSTNMVKICPFNEVPKKTRSVDMSFVCLDKYSQEAQMLRQKAEWGQGLAQIRGNHVQYRQRVLEPVQCINKNRQ